MCVGRVVCWRVVCWEGCVRVVYLTVSSCVFCLLVEGEKERERGPFLTHTHPPASRKRARASEREREKASPKGPCLTWLKKAGL